MLDNILGKKINDKNFGHMKITKDKDTNTFTLTKTIDFGPYKKIDLYLENQNPESTTTQFEMFNLLINNYPKIVKASNEKYFDKYKKDLFADFDIEFISFNGRDTNWELWLTKKGGFDKCVVEFDSLDIQGLSFQA